jgi:hypothetical protein
VAALPPPAAIAAAPRRTFHAPPDRVWDTTERVLKALGWGIDKRDPGAGQLITESRRLEGDNFGVYAKDLRHRLRLEIKPAGSGTLVSVERLVFRRERILWHNKDEPVESLPESMRGQQTEQGVLAATARSSCPTAARSWSAAWRRPTSG